MFRSTDIDVHPSLSTRKRNNVPWHSDRKFFLVGKKMMPGFLSDLKGPASKQ